jgi:hypothetical protein
MGRSFASSSFEATVAKQDGQIESNMPFSLRLCGKALPLTAVTAPAPVRQSESERVRIIVRE